MGSASWGNTLGVRIRIRVRVYADEEARRVPARCTESNINLGNYLPFKKVISHFKNFTVSIRLRVRIRVRVRVRPRTGRCEAPQDLSFGCGLSGTQYMIKEVPNTS